MFLIYVDESGDPGLLPKSPTRYFVLSGLVLHELEWKNTINAYRVFRKSLRDRYGLLMNEEIHAGHFIQKPGALSRLRKDLRLRILREVLLFQASLPHLSVINVVIDKQGKSPDFDAFGCAWEFLVQRFHNTLSYRNFPGPQNPQDKGLLVVDRSDERKLRTMLRRMARYNPVPVRGGGAYTQVLVNTIVEDPVHRDSALAGLIQLADVNAYFLFQHVQPCSFIRRQGASNWLVSCLGPVLCRHASSKDPNGIVRY